MKKEEFKSINVNSEPDDDQPLSITTLNSNDLLNSEVKVNKAYASLSIPANIKNKMNHKKMS